jgi:hypothetical protein
MASLRARVLAGVGLLCVALCVPSGALDKDLEEAQRRARRAFAGVLVTAKVDLRVDGRYHVTPDGLPIQKQGRKLEVVPGLGKKQANLRVGDAGVLWRIEAKPPDRIMVSLGRLRRHSLIFIHYDRPLRPGDLEPRAIVRALSGFVEFQGLESDAFDRAMRPVEIGEATIRIDGIAFDNPAGWSALELGAKVHIGREGSKMEIRVLESDLAADWAGKSSEFFLEERMPKAVELGLRKSLKKVAIEEVFPSRVVGSLYVGGATVRAAGKWYYRFDWVLEPAAGKAYHFYTSSAAFKDRHLYDQAVETILESVRDVRLTLTEPTRLAMPAVERSVPAASTVEAASTVTPAETPKGPLTTDLAGKVVARAEGMVRVEFEPRSEEAPAVGDKVDLTTVVSGYAVVSGSGEVAEVEPGAVWVRVLSGTPRLLDLAAIHPPRPEERQ